MGHSIYNIKIIYLKLRIIHKTDPQVQKVICGDKKKRV